MCALSVFAAAQFLSLVPQILQLPLQLTSQVQNVHATANHHFHPCAFETLRYCRSRAAGHMQYTARLYTARQMQSNRQAHDGCKFKTQQTEACRGCKDDMCMCIPCPPHCNDWRCDVMRCVFTVQPALSYGAHTRVQGSSKMVRTHSNVPHEIVLGRVQCSVRWYQTGQQKSMTSFCSCSN